MQTAPPAPPHAADTIGDLIDELEREARDTSRQLENTWTATGFLLPAGFTSHYYPLTQREHDAARVYRAAFTLTTDLDVCRALLNGERVPRHRLNQPMLQAHERRTRGR